MNERLKVFLDAYIAAALWSTRDDSEPDGYEFLDENFGPEDLAEETLQRMREDCEDFLTAHPEESDIPQLMQDLTMEELDQAGHDFWLTRNGHGAGFWDGDWANIPGWGDYGQKLTDRAHAYGSVDLYVGDDGLIYQL